jgi:hypothetical protein
MDRDLKPRHLLLLPLHRCARVPNVRAWCVIRIFSEGMVTEQWGCPSPTGPASSVLLAAEEGLRDSLGKMKDNTY